ncbi:hypothetical protein SRHO_G00119080 [Serrasalmus rhombeus]
MAGVPGPTGYSHGPEYKHLDATVIGYLTGGSLVTTNLSERRMGAEQPIQACVLEYYSESQCRTREPIQTQDARSDYTGQSERSGRACPNTGVKQSPKRAAQRCSFR